MTWGRGVRVRSKVVVEEERVKAVEGAGGKNGLE